MAQTRTLKGDIQIVGTTARLAWHRQNPVRKTAGYMAVLAVLVYVITMWTSTIANVRQDAAALMSIGLTAAAAVYAFDVLVATPLQRRAARRSRR